VPTTDAANALAALELAALHEHGSQIEVIESNQRVDEASHTVESTVRWRDTSTGINDVSRTLVAADRDHITATTADCLSASDVTAALRDACKAALASLDVGIPAAARIAVVPSSATPATATTEPGAKPSAPTMTEPPPRPTIPPISVPQDDPPADKRPLIVGAGLVLLAAVFWWNRKRRAQLVAEHGASKPDRTAAKRGDRDDR
jgi:hypothetical protein